MSELIVPRRVYYRTFAALAVLFVLTVVAASFDLGPLGPAVALLIAGSKAVLIVFFFMHVWYGSPLTRVIAASGFLWLAFMLTFTLSDYITRPWIPSADVSPMFEEPEGFAEGERESAE